ncbi:hypothetical protein A8C32_17045 [Flavivirga aquatica]|uniref:Uncharacterized protein n=1 Tax=Flavivirga aquatica TaxID=1849968 RepID=A0A1E5T8H0_9FLAO|nr:hypothetical protein [Flavivirga aquatica]OEK07685.1 hypothetical protein A8C32_17045 [Flavivirga aquatica]
MDLKYCPACKNDNNSKVDFCIKCDFPLTGTEKDKSIRIGKFIGKKGIIFDADNSLEKSRKLLYYAAAFFILGIIINFSSLTNNILALGFNISIAMVILTCGILIKKAPLVFLLIPLILLLSIYGLNYMYDPTSLPRGIFFKLLIIGSLIYSIYNYLASEKFKKKYNY